MRPPDANANDHAPAPADAAAGPLARAMVYFPRGVFLMTAAYEDDRSGIRVLTAHQCSEEPILIAVAARKGHSIEPLIRDSHHFALCVVDPDDRLLSHKFPPGGEPVGGGDPFDSIPHETLVSAAPVPTRCIAAFDCEVVRHFDLEADHEIYVGQILRTKVYQDSPDKPV
jgi:flavin reductase (DIM6/NTAB) family NADH-FMN oxidoreductase RutF